MFSTPYGQHCAPWGPAKILWMSFPTSSLDSEHPCPLEDILSIPPSLQDHILLTGPEAWQPCNSTFLPAIARDWIFLPTAVHLQHSCLCPAWDPWKLLFIQISHSVLSACTGFVSLQDFVGVGASSSFSLSKLCIVHWFLQILLHRMEMHCIFAQPLPTGVLVYAGCHRQCLFTCNFLLGSDFELHMTLCVKPLPALSWFFTSSLLSRHCPPPSMIYLCFLTSVHSLSHINSVPSFNLPQKVSVWTFIITQSYYRLCSENHKGISAARDHLPNIPPLPAHAKRCTYVSFVSCWHNRHHDEASDMCFHS